MTKMPLHAFCCGLHRDRLPSLLLIVALAATLNCAAQTKPGADPEPDVLVLSNGDTLHGKLVNVINGNVKFHCDPLGDVILSWDKIKELHSSQNFAVLHENAKLRGKSSVSQIPAGTVEVANQAVTIHPQNAVPLAPIPVKDAQYILDVATLNRQVEHQPSFFSGWNGSATAGGAVVTATQRQFTLSGGIGLVRVVPTVNWFDPHDRTSMAFTGSYGRISEPAYTNSNGVYVPEDVTKSAIYHAEAERDEYFSPRIFALAQMAFDHNFSQNLDLQQIYGGGIGWTVLKKPRQELDLKGTLQYEKQQFIGGFGNADQNLFGSTFSANYVLGLKLFTFTQNLAHLLSYNNPHAYSANESNTLVFPLFKNLGFTVGTIDSYLNNPPVAEPPTKRNSFQFTMGLNYAFNSKY